MRALPVRAGDDVFYTFVDDEDAERIGSHKLSLGSHGYPQVFMREAGYVVPVHRFVMGCKPHDGKIVDHINRCRLDNQKCNLRFVNASESSSNVEHHPISKFRGVYPNHGRWMARGKLAGKIYYLGTYDTPEEAAEVSHAWRVAHLPGYVW
jgi:hypothetical protein